MAKTVHGALLEYGDDLLGPVPNLIIFQFNPEQIARSFSLPPAREGGEQRRQVETGQTAAPPLESFSLTAHFSAADHIGNGGPLADIARTFGIGPQLAALERMVTPPGGPQGLIGQALDAIGDAISGAAGSPPTRSVPRERLARILFIWGPTRVLPVRITSLSIKEEKFDNLLNPVQAEAQIGLSVAAAPPASDLIAQGALTYTLTIKEAQTIVNVANSVLMLPEIIPF